MPVEKYTYAYYIYIFYKYCTGYEISTAMYSFSVDISSCNKLTWWWLRLLSPSFPSIQLKLGSHILPAGPIGVIGDHDSLRTSKLTFRSNSVTSPQPSAFHSYCRVDVDSIIGQISYNWSNVILCWTKNSPHVRNYSGIATTIYHSVRLTMPHHIVAIWQSLPGFLVSLIHVPALFLLFSWSPCQTSNSAGY